MNSIYKHIWFTADQHFGHDNIRGYTNRPYDSVLEMDEDLIRRWNGVVDQYDTVYHLGDFTLGSVELAKQYFQRLNGTVHILSNPWHHDTRWINKTSECITKSGSSVLIESSLEVLEIKELGKDNYPLAISLCHYPLAVWDRKHYGAWHLHGHSHNAYYADGFILDVGVDSAAAWLNEYRPFNLSEIIDIMSSKEISHN